MIYDYVETWIVVFFNIYLSLFFCFNVTFHFLSPLVRITPGCPFRSVSFSFCPLTNPLIFLASSPLTHYSPWPPHPVPFNITLLLGCFLPSNFLSTPNVLITVSFCPAQHPVSLNSPYPVLLHNSLLPLRIRLSFCSICPSVGLRKDFWTSCHKTWLKRVAWTKKRAHLF